MLTAISSVLAFMAVAFVAPAATRADTSPPAGTPATVSADGLPTWQMNGVAWSQVIVGTTVYVAGSFTKARPPGSAVGTNEVARTNLLSYNITTGNLITTFHPLLNAQALVVAASPDGSRIYVGGDFTTVDSQAHSHLAAFDTATGALINTFNASVSSQAASIVATATTVYVGGTFNHSGAVIRNNAAAFSAPVNVAVASGSLLAWNPNADGAVNAMTLSQSGLVLGGRFFALGGLTRRGLGGVNLTTGALTTWPSTLVIYDYGLNAGFTSLSTDGTNVYGTGYNFGANGGQGNFEGRFAITSTGSIVWLDDCHGDSYSAFPIGSVLYSVGHSHNCATVGAFPETNPRTWHRAIADTTAVTGTLKTNTQAGYDNFAGTPSPTQLDWYPAFAAGTFTGEFQGGWTVTANSSYVVVGGEFPTVNKVNQQGLVRFAIPSIAPGKLGPQTSAALTPTASLPTSKTVKLTWGTTWDPDNGILTYGVLRDSGTTPIASLTVDSRFWTVPAPAQTFTDTSAANGSHTYRIQVTDPFKNTITGAASNAVTVSGSTNTNSPPTAAFTSSCTQLSCSFNASSSSDSDGSITSYTWNFGDGSTGSGATPPHAYASGGTYTVTLTVTDNGGATAQKSANLTASAVVTPPGTIAADSFNRAVSNGLGTADVGGPWTSINTASRLSVTPGVASLALTGAGINTSAVLGSTSSSDAVVTTTISADKIADGGGTYFSLAGRRIAATQEYRAVVRVLSTGVVQFYIAKLDNSSTEVLVGPAATLPSFTYTPGTLLRVKLSVVGTGTTALSLKVWPAAGTEPATPQISTSDASASLQFAGSVGIRGYLSSTSTSAPVNVSVQAFSATNSA